MPFIKDIISIDIESANEQQAKETGANYQLKTINQMYTSSVKIVVFFKFPFGEKKNMNICFS